MSEREGGRRDSVRVRKGDVGTEAESQRDGSLELLALRMEEGAVGQGVRAAPGS